MGPVGEGFGTALIIMIVICGGLFYGIFRGLEHWITDGSIRSEKPIKPRIELVIRNNRVDTIYVYKNP